MHWEFGRNNPSNPVHPDIVNGETSDSFATKTSTNELIGGFTASQDVATRDEFVDEGAWETVGWLAPVDNRGLPIHRHGLGYEQTFQNHDGLGGIYVPDSIGDAFWVRPEFWGLYESLGGPTGYLKHPVGDHLVPCPQGAPSPCDAYQDFECGFIYDDGSSVLPFHLCIYAGLYAIKVGGTDEYRHMGFGESAWATVEEQTPTGGSQNLKQYGDFMVHKEGGGSGQTFRISTDGGETWTQTPKPIDDTSYRPVDADLCPDGRLWLAWQKFSGGSTNRVRIYYSDDFGQTIALSKDHNIGGIGSAAAHSNGALTCHTTDRDRVAIVVQRSSSARLIVSTDATASQATWLNYTTSGLANAFSMVWSGDRLVMIYDAGSQVRVRISDADGASITQTAGLNQGGSNRSDQVGVIRTTVESLLFAFAYDSGSGVTPYVLRSTDNGDTWEQVGSFPSGVSSPNALVYDADSDHLYGAWGSGNIRALPVAATRAWDEVLGSSWAVLAGAGGELGDRTLALDGQGAIGLLGR